MTLPSPETMLTYASILEKPQYHIDKNGRKWLLATGEIIEAACAALRHCASEQTKEDERKKNCRHFNKFGSGSVGSDGSSSFKWHCNDCGRSGSSEYAIPALTSTDNSPTENKG